MKKLPLAMVLTVALSLACDDNENFISQPQPIHFGEIMPLAVGNEWSGTLHIYGGAEDEHIPWSYFITGDTIIADEKWYWISAVEGDDTTCNAWLLTNRSDGLWKRTASSDPLLVARYPASVGDTFSQYRWVITTDGILLCSLGVMRFYEYRVEMPATGGLATRELYSPGVGPVHLEIRGGLPDRITIFALEDYRLVSPAN